MGILLFNIVAGLMLDAFAEIREEADKRDEILSDTCFVCGMVGDPASVTCPDKACLRSLLGAAGARAFAHTCSNGVDCSLQDDLMGHGGHADEPNFAVWSKFRLPDNIQPRQHSASTFSPGETME